MRFDIRLRSGVARSALVGLTALAGLLPASLAAAATTQHAAPTRQSPAAITFTWHKLNLINGWKANGQGDATPAYAISGGVVYLDGSITQAAPGADVFAVLPKAARPSHTLLRPVLAANLAVGSLEIKPDGTMRAYDTGASAYTSLAAVSFPVTGFTWHKLTLLNGWKSATQLFHTGDPAYAVKNHVVYLSGSLVQGGSNNILIAVLPKAARPVHKMYLLTCNFFHCTSTLSVGSNGDLTVTSTPQGDAQDFTSLDTVSYPAPGTTWHKLSLVNGWQTVGAAFGSPAYAVIGGVVYLSGSTFEPTGSNSHFTNLPQAIKPTHYLAIAMFTAGGTWGGVGIPANGQVTTNSNPFVNAQGYTSLSAIGYPRSS